MRGQYLQSVVGALILVLHCLSSAHAFTTLPDRQPTASVSLGAEFASGTYGSEYTTRSVYVPLIVTWSPLSRIDVGIEIPYLYQSSSTDTTVTTATAAKTVVRGGPGSNSANAALLLSQPSQPLGITGVSASSGTSVSGPGDIILRVGAIALTEGAMFPLIRPSVSVKCPTANASDGLGTGEFDVGVGVELVKWVGDLHLTGEGVYNYQGKVDGYGLENYFSYSAGIGYQLKNSVEPMVLVKGATAPSSFSGSLLETRIRVLWPLTDTTSLDLFGSRGLTDSSLDYGGGFAVIYSF